MTEREKGVASAACPNCGKELALSEQLDGGMAAETCTSCHPADEPSKKTEKASASSTPRERGTTLQSNEEQ